MEMSKQSYWEVIQMPFYKMKKYLKWKNELEDTRKKLLDAKRESIK